MTKPIRTAVILATVSVSAFLAACQTPLPNVQRLPTMADSAAATRERFRQDGGDLGVRKVRVPMSSMQAKAVRSPVSPALRARAARIQFAASNDATVNDLTQTLSASGVQIAFRWVNAKGDEILKRRLPFANYNGTVGGLLDALRTGIGIVAWQEGQTIFLSDAERYTVALPQDEDILKQVADTLKSLGATDVVTSLDGGKVIYSATPGNQDEIIGPFMKRMVRNLATINLQVAIVSLAVTDKSAHGFDWSKFGVGFDSRDDAIAGAYRSGQAQNQPTNGTNTGTGTNTTTNTTNQVLSSTTSSQQQGPGNFLPKSRGDQKGGLVDLAKDGLILGTTQTPQILGIRSVVSVAGAIDWLSTFGNTNVTQHVDLRTLSGKPVKFRSGQEIPYVKGVGVSSNGSTNSGNVSGGSNNLLGSTQTDTVKTGLTVEIKPRYDSDAELVISNLKMELKSVLEFVQLSAGNQIGTLTQPRTQEQELNDVVRLKAGQTAILGGLQYDQEQFDGNEPTFARDALKKMSSSVGRRAQDVSRNALFIIIRPVVTVYEPDGDEVGSAGVSK